MTKSIKALAILGVIAGLGVASLPLSSYAEDAQNEQTLTAQVTLASYISCEMAKDAESTVTIDGVINNGAAKDASTKINVKTNSQKGYIVNIKAAGTETALVAENDTDKIPALTSPVATIPSGTSAWGYKGGDITDFTGITTDDTALKTTTTALTSDDGEDIEVTFGAVAGAAQAPGTYSQSVILTASVNPAV